MVRRATKTKPKTEAAPRDGGFVRGRRLTNTQLVRNYVAARTAWFQKNMDGPNRDLNEQCGYPETLTIKDYRDYVEREGIARRVVGCESDESWSVYPELYEKDGKDVTDWEKTWKKLSYTLKPWAIFKRADTLSGIGSFGVVLLGVKDAQTLDKPVANLDPRTGKRKENTTQTYDVVYLKPFAEDQVEIVAVDTDDRSERFGQPTMYEVLVEDIGSGFSGVMTSVDRPARKKQRVHWTRIIHLADNRESSDIRGVPRLQPVFNNVFNIRKVLGSSPEMYYKGGFPGLSLEALPEVDPEDLDLDTIRDQMEAYFEGLQRYIAIGGLKATSLAPNISDPTPHVIGQIQIICATLRIPLRIFLGSEAGHLAAQQDSVTWNRRLNERQQNYINPFIIEPFMDRLMAIGALPQVESYRIVWRDLNAMTDKDKADVLLKKTQALLQYVGSGSETMIPPMEFLTYWMEFNEEEARAMLASAQKVGRQKLTKKLWDPNILNSPAAGNTRPDKKTGASGRRNSLGNK